MVALIYNWWSLFVRLWPIRSTHREAINQPAVAVVGYPLGARQHAGKVS